MGNSVVASQGHSTLLKWLRSTPEFMENRDAIYPMQRACLAALACVCKHGQDCASALLAEELSPPPPQHVVQRHENATILRMGALQDIIDWMGDSDMGMRRSALRCLARLMPHSVDRTSAGSRLEADTKNKDGDEVWTLILRQLED